VYIANPTVALKREIFKLTADLDDHQPCPPFSGDGSRWRIVCRFDGRTIFEQTVPPTHAAARRTAAGVHHSRLNPKPQRT
jgi:hypothetical protein